MKDQSVEKSKTPKFDKLEFLLNAIAHVHFRADPDAPVWAKNARAQFLRSFDFLKAQSKFYRSGYRQAGWDIMGEKFAKTSALRAAQHKAAVENPEIADYQPRELRGTTDIEKRDFYAGKVDGRERYSDGGLSPRQKSMFFLATHYECFEGLGQKETHKIFVELKLIASNTDESQTRQWLGEIGFRSGQRGRPAKPKT